MRPFLDELAARLEEIHSSGLGRVLKDPAGLDFSSNDYLGLSRHPLLIERLRGRLSGESALEPIGSPSSRLLRGSTPAHRALEERLARFKGTEAALLFPSGYQANIALLTALLGPRDQAVSDERNHASLIDGIRLSGCEKAIFPHGDLERAEAALRDPPPGGRAFLITESLFSMDGDAARLDLLADIAERRGACLIVDDAHATGVYGRERGSGLTEELGVERRATAIVSTFGKALGLSGSFVAGPRVLIDYLVNRARPFIFTTATPPLLLAAVEILLDLAREEPWRRGKVLTLARRFREGLLSRSVAFLPGYGPIVPVVLGENERAMRIALEVSGRGYDVRAVRPPTVPPGTARLRISVHADHTEEEIDGLAAALAEAVAMHPTSAASASSRAER